MINLNLEAVMIGIVLYVITGKIMGKIMCYLIMIPYLRSIGHDNESIKIIVDSAVNMILAEGKYCGWIAGNLGWPLSQVNYMQHLLIAEADLRKIREAKNGSRE